MREYFEYLFELNERPWKSVPNWGMYCWIAFYAFVLWSAFRSTTGFLAIDNVNLVVHEGGHLLFGFFGWETLTILGGTLLQWLVPLLLALTFWSQRHLSGTVFCLFFFFENFLYTAVYMADALRMELPLVTVGGVADESSHDWNNLFTRWDLISKTNQIAGTVRVLGWLGMIATVLWFWYRNTQQESERVRRETLQMATLDAVARKAKADRLRKEAAERENRL